MSIYPVSLNDVAINKGYDVATRGQKLPNKYDAFMISASLGNRVVRCHPFAVGRAVCPIISPNQAKLTLGQCEKRCFTL
jgi:hypothetical protein